MESLVGHGGVAENALALTLPWFSRHIEYLFIIIIGMVVVECVCYLLCFSNKNPKVYSTYSKTLIFFPIKIDSKANKK